MFGDICRLYSSGERVLLTRLTGDSAEPEMNQEVRLRLRST